MPARRDVELHGQVIPDGPLVLLMLGSANCDPKHFRDAGLFDITRDPNPHIAFGHGIHASLGAPLAHSSDPPCTRHGTPGPASRPSPPVRN